VRMSASSLVAEVVWKDIESTRSGCFFCLLFYFKTDIDYFFSTLNDFSLDFSIIYAAIW
jgi:hypothetical protein